MGANKMSKEKKKRREFRKYEELLRKEVINDNLGLMDYWDKLHTKIAMLGLSDSIKLNIVDDQIIITTLAGTTTLTISFMKDSSINFKETKKEDSLLIVTHPIEMRLGSQKPIQFDIK